MLPGELVTDTSLPQLSGTVLVLGSVSRLSVPPSPGITSCCSLVQDMAIPAEDSTRSSVLARFNMIPPVHLVANGVQLEVGGPAVSSSGGRPTGRLLRRRGNSGHRRSSPCCDSNSVASPTINAQMLRMLFSLRMLTLHQGQRQIRVVDHYREQPSTIVLLTQDGDDLTDIAHGLN